MTAIYIALSIEILSVAVGAYCVYRAALHWHGRNRTLVRYWWVTTKCLLRR